MQKNRSRKRNRTRRKALRLVLRQNFPRATKKQIQDIAEDYRDYLCHYLRLHLSPEDFDLLVSSPYCSTVLTEVPGKDEPEYVQKFGYYYHEVLGTLRKAATFLHPQDIGSFFLNDISPFRDDKREPLAIEACNIWSFAEGYGMEILRNFFDNYAYTMPSTDHSEEDDIEKAPVDLAEEQEEQPEDGTDEEDEGWEDPVDLAWKDQRWEEYLDEYAKTHANELRQNPWDFPELAKHFWPWREKLAWYQQKRKGAVIRETVHPVNPKESMPLCKASLWDSTTPAFVDLEKDFFFADREEFQRRRFRLKIQGCWIHLDANENEKEAFLAWKESADKAIQEGVARLLADKTFLVEDAWFSAINWFGKHRKYHVNRWTFQVRWISFRADGKNEDEYFRLISHQAQGVCRVEIFPRLMTAIEACSGNSVLECTAPYHPEYSIRTPYREWPRPDFEDFKDNCIRSICFLADRVFESEEEVKNDARDFTITEEVMREMFEEV